MLMAASNLYTHHNRLDEAKDMYLRALETRTNTLGTEHQLMLNCLYGNLHLKQGKLTEAERMYKDLIIGRKQGLIVDDDILLDALLVVILTMNSIMDRKAFI